MNDIHYFNEALKGIEGGDINALDIYGELKQYIKRLQEIEEKMKVFALQEAEQYGTEAFEHGDFRYQLRKGGAMYDYSVIAEWKEMKDSMKEIEEQAKQAFLLSRSGAFLVGEDGDVAELPRVTYKSDSLTVR
jgi:hypothetical protein